MKHTYTDAIIGKPCQSVEYYTYPATVDIGRCKLCGHAYSTQCTKCEHWKGATK